MNTLRCHPHVAATIVTLMASIPSDVAGQSDMGRSPVESRHIAFTTGEGTDLAFDLSPDGSWIVFDLLGQLWRMPADGGRASPLTNAARGASDDRDPNISPDGRWILFQSHRPDGNGLWLIPAGGGEARRLGIEGISGTSGWWRPYFYSKPAWSPDGRTIAYVHGRGNGELRLLDLESGTSQSVELEDSASSVIDVTWLPDGRHMLYRQGTKFGRGEQGLWPIAPAQHPMGEFPTDSVFRLDLESGTRERILPASVAAVALSLSRDGTRVAFFAPDEEERYQVWAMTPTGGELVQITEQDGIVPLRVRWTPDGEHLLYSAAGKLWKVPSADGAFREIPFQARVDFERRAVRSPVTFAEPGSERAARGHRGVALSADGERIAMIALGKLWIWPVGGAPHAVVDLPPTVSGLTWSPDGTKLAWAAGSGGAEDLFATNVSTGHTRRLTALPATAYRPEWSPDGRRIAFLQAWGDQRDLRLAMIDAFGETVRDTSEVRYLASLRRPFTIDQQPVHVSWTVAGDELLVYGDGAWGLVGLDGTARTLTGHAGPTPTTQDVMSSASFVRFADDSTVVFTRENLLWSARVRNDSVLDPVAISQKPATYPTSDRAGTVLYLSDDGYRLASLDGTARSLGWPALTYRTREAAPLLLRDVRVVDGTGAPPEGRRDILIGDGRIVRIASPGRIVPPARVPVIEGNGRTVIPGLIDIHHHYPEPLSAAGMLYWGVTTTLGMGNDVADVAAFAEEIEAGIVPGPRSLFSGFTFIPGVTGAMDGTSGPRMQTSSDPAANARALALLNAFGASHVKLFQPATLGAGVELIRQAQRHGLRVGGHGPGSLPLVAAGVNDQQHHLAGEMYQDLAQLFRHGGLGIVPTLVVATTRSRLLADSSYLERTDVESFMTPHHRIRARRVMDCMGPWRGCWDPPPGVVAVARLKEAGAVVGTGSDYSVVPVPGILHWELEELVRLGLTPLEAINAATSNAASIIGAEAEIGTIEVGKRADLILLDADPLEDIRNTRSIAHVIQEGRVVDREALIESARGNQ